MFNLLAQIKMVDGGSGDDEELKISGYASTTSEDRARDVIQSAAWTKGGLNNYQKNPILLFNHDYNNPIGKATLISADDGGLFIEGTIVPGTKEYRLIKSGILKTFSVGFLIKDAEYLDKTGGLLVTDAELLEISVVSVPCNQDATFELSKSASSQKDYTQILEKFGKKADEGASAPETKQMTEEEMNEKMALVAAEAAEKALAADKAAREKAASEAEAARKSSEESETRTRAIIEETVAEKITKAIEGALEKNNGAELAETVSKLSEDLSKYGEEMMKFQDSRREGFFPGQGSGEKLWEKGSETRDKAIEGYILSKALRKPLVEIQSQKSLVEKVNTMSSVQVSSNDFEQRVSTEIMRDIELELTVAPLFRSIALTSASQLIPIAPDNGYATHQVTGATLPGTVPNGLLTEVGGVQPYALNEITLRTDKLVSKAYLANDTEEDTILPILPLIREGMIRQHAKSMDQMMLTAGVVGGVFPNMVSRGLAAYSATNGRAVVGPAIGGKYRAANLMAGRRNLGKYGISPNDLVYLVSVTAYFDLLDDPEFHDNFQVGNGTKVTGEIGRIFGSRVIVSSEISEATTANTIGVYALNTRNFIVPRLRGLTSESEYSVEGQHWVLATTQRLGFNELIPNARSVTAVRYAAV